MYKLRFSRTAKNALKHVSYISVCPPANMVVIIWIGIWDDSDKWRCHQNWNAQVVNWHFMILKESNWVGWLVQVKWNKTWRLNNLFRTLNVSKMQTSVFLGKHMRKQRLGGQQSISNGLPGFLFFSIEGRSQPWKVRIQSRIRKNHIDCSPRTRMSTWGRGKAFSVAISQSNRAPKEIFFSFGWDLFDILGRWPTCSIYLVVAIRLITLQKDGPWS